jgi:hypothetical protein
VCTQLEEEEQRVGDEHGERDGPGQHQL